MVDIIVAKIENYKHFKAITSANGSSVSSFADIIMNSVLLGKS